MTDARKPDSAESGKIPLHNFIMGDASRRPYCSRCGVYRDDAESVQCERRKDRRSRLIIDALQAIALISWERR